MVDPSEPCDGQGRGELVSWLMSYDPWKRAADVALAVLLLVALVPLFLPVGLLVALSSRGPVIYAQARIGWNRRWFTIYKFRTMVHDCERLTGPRWSTSDDPRVTPIGRFLRKSHLDELPQLWNVLRGDMSLVGPRPERPEFVGPLEKALPRYADRLLVRPGLTGLAQAQLPPDTDEESVRRKLVCDLDYVQRLSLGLDARLLLATALFMMGIPFAASGRVLRLRTEGIEADRPIRSVGDVELVAHVQPAWYE